MPGMGRRPLKTALEVDALHWRKRYCYTVNRHGVIVAFVKRTVHKRERREGKREARSSSER